MSEGIVGKEFIVVNCKHLTRKGTLIWSREEVYFRYDEHAF